MSLRELDEDYVRQHLEVRPGPYVLLSVSDTGCGMDEQTKARIFEPFFTTKEVGNGTGLGLSTVYGIIKQSGGHIEVESASGCGTTFRIFLPLTDQAEPADATAESLFSRPSGTETVLLVEDEPAVCALGRMALESGGYTVLTAEGPKEALSLAQQHSETIHLLITDVVMPQMNGRELAERLVQSRPELRVLNVTRSADDAVLRHGILAEKSMLLSKPFSVSMFLQKVREVLGMASQGVLST